MGEQMADPGKPLVSAVTLRGFLSFGPDVAKFPLERLNVLIGPKASGKSNFVEAMTVLRAVPRDLPRLIRQGGTVGDWLWKRGPGIEGAEGFVHGLWALIEAPKHAQVTTIEVRSRFTRTWLNGQSMSQLYVPPACVV